MKDLNKEELIDYLKPYFPEDFSTEDLIFEDLNPDSLIKILREYVVPSNGGKLLQDLWFDTFYFDGDTFKVNSVDEVIYKRYFNVSEALYDSYITDPESYRIFKRYVNDEDDIRKLLNKIRNIKW